MVSQGKTARKSPCVACMFVKEQKTEFEEVSSPKGQIGASGEQE